MYSQSSSNSKVDGLPRRTEYPASKYNNGAAVNSTFSAFFFQFPSLLRYMRKMEDREKRSNVQSLFGVSGVPNDNQIRNIVDKMEPSALNPVFNETLKRVVNEYRVLDEGVLLAQDGL